MESEYKIEKLHNEDQWSFQIKQSVIAVGAFDLISGVEEKSADIVQNGPKIKKWRKLGSKARRIIDTSIASSLTIHIQNCDPAIRMWDKLHSVFEKKTQVFVVW